MGSLQSPVGSLQSPVGSQQSAVIPKCVDIIKPQHILDRLNYYYDGGRLTKGKKSPVFFENINKMLEKNRKNVYINSNLEIEDRGSGFVYPRFDTRIIKPENIGIK